MVYLLAATITLLVLELVYFRLAMRFDITDRPNRRSSHHHIVLRGAGIIFPVSVVCYEILNGFIHPLFALGLLLLAIVSFMDDIKPVRATLRFLVQLVAAALLLMQIEFNPVFWVFWPMALIAISGIMNAWNFMDGINGLTAGVSIITVLTFMLINHRQSIIDPHFLLWVLGGLLVFAFFNMRTNAKCFAGDTGSITIAFILLFVMGLLLLKTKNPLYLLMFVVYGVDSISTIVMRLRKGENVFLPHRQHLYQYLSNEMGWSHLKVTALYTGIQMAINALMLLLLQMSEGIAFSIALLIVGCMVGLYLVVKQQILRKLAIK